MCLRLVAAMVTADAIDRRIKDRRRAAADARAATHASVAAPASSKGRCEHPPPWEERE